MSFDFSSVLLDPLYTSDLAVDATLTVGATEYALRAMDETGAKTVGANIDVPTILPQACVRYSELTGFGLNKNDVIGGTLEINGVAWTISNIGPEPSPSGERRGEVRLMLVDPAELASSE